MSWLGDFFGGVANTVTGGLIGSLFGENAAENQQSRNLEQMKQQYEYNKEMYQNRYQWTAQDMKKAGLNMILAATQGIGGSPQGVGMAPTGMANTGEYANALNSAYQTSTQREIAKLNAQVQREGLALRKSEITNAKEKQDNDIKIANARFELDKVIQEAAMKRADELNKAQIQNMKDRLAAEIEHWKNMDLNQAGMVSAAIASANAAGLQAEVAASLGISKQEVMDAEKAFIGLQSDNAAEALRWQRWLNDHPQTRGAVGFLGAMFDTVGLVKRTVSTAYTGIKSTGIGDDW